MNTEEIKDANTINKGDNLLVKNNKGKIKFYTKVDIGYDLNLKEVLLNKTDYFSVKMFNIGKSWIKEIIKIND